MKISKPEAALREDWAKHIFPFLPDFTWERIENLATNGTPDLGYTLYDTHGYIELKYHGIKRETTPLKIPKFTNTQRSWNYRRGRNGAPVFLLLRTVNYDILIGHSSVITIDNLSLKDLKLKKDVLFFLRDKIEYIKEDNATLLQLSTLLKGGYFKICECLYNTYMLNTEKEPVTWPVFCADPYRYIIKREKL